MAIGVTAVDRFDESNMILVGFVAASVIVVGDSAMIIVDVIGTVVVAVVVLVVADVDVNAPMVVVVLVVVDGSVSKEGMYRRTYRKYWNIRQLLTRHHSSAKRRM